MRYTFLGLTIALALFVPASPSMAEMPDQPLDPRISLGQLALSESVPAAFNPDHFEISDFDLRWVQGSAQSLPVGLTLRLIPNSLEWVRVHDVLVVPRGMLQVRVPQAVTPVVVSQYGLHQPLAEGDHQVAVALLSGASNFIDIQLANGDKVTHIQIEIFYKGASRIFQDTSCTPFRIKTDRSTLRAQNQWIYLGCRTIHGQSEAYPISHLDLIVHWEDGNQAIDTILVEKNIPLSASAPSTWSLRFRPNTNIQLTTQRGTLFLEPSVAERDRYGLFGLGIGPYAYNRTEATGITSAPIALVTLYAGYFIAEGLRLTAFNATTLHSRYFSDTGVYLNTQSLKTLDNRFYFNLMLGAHVLAFQNGASTTFRPSLPQGVEFIVRDCLWRGYNMTFGGFLYPQIGGQQYNNLWIRFGSPRLFGELNYISWREPTTVDTQTLSIYSRSVGITFGFPLARFL